MVVWSWGVKMAKKAGPYHEKNVVLSFQNLISAHQLIFTAPVPLIDPLLLSTKLDESILRFYWTLTVFLHIQTSLNHPNSVLNIYTALVWPRIYCADTSAAHSSICSLFSPGRFTQSVYRPLSGVSAWAEAVGHGRVDRSQIDCLWAGNVRNFATSD